MTPPRISILLLLVTALVVGGSGFGCGKLSEPSPAQAATDVQGFLDEVDEGIWKVDRVEKTNGRDGTVDGTPAYIMEARIHVTLQKNKKNWNVFQLIGETIWLSDLGGRKGETKISRPVTITWIKTEKGWQYTGTACISC